MTVADVQSSSAPAPGTAPVLSVHNLVKHFPVRSRGLIRRVIGYVHAVCDVSFDIYPGETLGWWANPAAARRRRAEPF